MFYRGKHHKKRFKPAIEEYKTQLIFYWICFKRKIFRLFGWWVGLIDKHDDWWDRTERLVGWKVDKYWGILRHKLYFVKNKFEIFSNFLYNIYRK